ncbi:hypothetical protein BGZ57DRAFT_377252 [Hyaloscypha finlandica]|nr:hypothetical protein BGZ57DRAFT_377252 [Hyaloscypha finlandica]
MAYSTDTTDTASLKGTNAPDAFYPIQSSFTFARRERPPEVYVSPEDGNESRVPLKQPKVQRRESKGGLRGMFTRNKTEKKPVHPVLEEFTSASSSSEPPDTQRDPALPRTISIRRTGTASESIPATPVTPGRPASRHSRINMRSKSVKHKTPVKPSPKSSNSASKTSPKRPSAAWDPPPLFQAYPQSIKHAQLSASTLSADSILRISNHQRNNSLREGIAQVRSVDGQDQSTAAKKSEKARAKHRRQISGSISKAEWTQKIFVLVTSGYLLQYAGEGSFDRLPEKMMQLGKDSVAFASDVIPGKHWVLQISQAMDADGTPASDSRSLLSRLAFRGADYRRTATSLLLVLNSAEEMDSWLAVVRREIEALGGKKHVSETGKPKPDDKIMQLKAQPSHRYLVQRDPDQFPDPSSPRLPSFGPPPWVKQKDDELQQQLADAAAALAGPQNDLARPSTGHHSISHQSITTSITSHDERQLESLRNSSNRFSYMSSSQRTLITSNGSSPATSPTRDTFDDFPLKISTEEVRPRPNAAAINERRRSMQTMHVPILEAQQAPKAYRHSTYGGPARSARVHSPATPNFSVPNSSSKRYSTMKSSATDAPPVPSIIKTTPGKTQESMWNGTRKPAPTTLNTTRPLSQVEDSSPSKRKSALKTPTDAPFSEQQRSKPSMVEILPKIMASPPPEDGLAPRSQISSLTPISSTEIAPIDVQFPRRFSSMQDLCEDRQRELPFRSSPLPPAEILTPLSTSPAIHEVEIEDEFAVHETERENLSPLPVLANTKSKIRRPNSMQVRTSSLAALDGHTPEHSADFQVLPYQVLSSANQHRPFSITSTASSGELNRDLNSSAQPISLISPHLQRLKADSKKALVNRRSMPTLVNGPPPAPPPDCALPPLPPGSGMRSPVRSRNSVRV